MHRGSYPKMPPDIMMRIDTSKIDFYEERIVNALQCQSLLSAHWWEATLFSWAMSLFDKGSIINNNIILKDSQLERFEYWHIWKYLWCFFRKWHLYFACKIWKLLMVKLIVWISFESCLESELSESHILDRRFVSVIDKKKDLDYEAKQKVFYSAL